MAMLLAISLVLSGGSGRPGLRPAGFMDGDASPAARPIRDCSGCPEMVSVQGAGEGGRPLWVAANETTWAEYLRSVVVEACAPPHLMEKSLSGTLANIVRLASSDQHPVTGVSFAKIECFAQWLSSKKGRHYRLPTDAEWERFARSGVKTQYPWGNTLLPERAALRLHTVQRGNQMMEIGPNTYEGLPVRSFPPNQAGLYDVIGNALELTTTCRQSELNTATREQKEQAGCHFFIRGGGYNATGQEATLSSRLYVRSTPEMNGVGFRLVADQ